MLKKTVTAEIKVDNLIKEATEEEAKKVLKNKSEDNKKKESTDDDKVESKSSN